MRRNFAIIGVLSFITLSNLLRSKALQQYLSFVSQQNRGWEPSSSYQYSSTEDGNLTSKKFLLQPDDFRYVDVPGSRKKQLYTSLRYFGLTEEDVKSEIEDPHKRFFKFKRTKKGRKKTFPGVQTSKENLKSVPKKNPTLRGAATALINSIFLLKDLDKRARIITNDKSNRQISRVRLEGFAAGQPRSNDSTSALVWDKHMLDSAQSVQVGDARGSIQDGRLVVNVNHTHMFWNNGQTALCQLLRKMTLVDSLDENPSQENVTTANVPPRYLLNVTMDCVQMKMNEVFGQGNWITALYCVRIAAALAKVDFQFQCTDGKESQLDLLLPWFDGFHPAPNEDQPWPYVGTLPTESEVCTDKYPKIRIDKMADQVRDDIQKMAVTLIGSRDEVRRHPSISISQAPLVPNITLDDVAIHFRCGDVMGGARRGDFGMIHFSEYKKRISRKARSVGILTQPFEKGLNRGVDSGKVDSCRQATYLLVNYLQDFLPKASITIRNDQAETLPLAYARLAMANQSFTSLSSFGIFPIIGTFGEGYFQKGNRGINPFAQYLPEYYPNLHMMDAPVLTTGSIYNMRLNDTLAWFVS